MPIPILLDCDPGHDDAVAILLALASPGLDLLGITTVGGNAALERVTDNTLRILALAGRPDIPVAAGAAHPLRGPLRTAPHVHGESGLEGPALPEPVSAAIDEDAVSFMARVLGAHGRPVTLVPTGPLTNIARLLIDHRDLRPQIERICLMGGAIGEGNVTPSAEFNIWVDPEAADVVFGAGLPITMIGLDVTHQSIVWEAEYRAMAADGGTVSRLVAGLLEYFQAFHERVYGWQGTPIHDAVAVAHLAHPGLVRTRPYAVAIELDGGLTRGRTVVDLRGVTGRPPNADVGVSIDRDRFVGHLVAAIRSFD
jgi:purine nucleosidase/pyrimidine-specific ribonucleoside hydrolase